MNQILQTEYTFAPTIAALVQVAEMTGASGPDKLQAVVQIASNALSATPVPPTVAAITQVVNMTVALFNTLLWKRKPAPAAVEQSAATQE
jgi:hypothetical protein